MDHRARFDALFAAANGQGDAAAGLELARMLVRMRAKQPHPRIDAAWEAALAVPWDRPDGMAPAALAYIALHPSVARALAQPDDAEALPPAIEHLSRLRMFHLVMGGALVTSAEWQGLFLRWRRWAFARGGRAPGLGWVAVQANLAEYVWPIDVAEADLAPLRQRVAAESADANEVVLLACFEHPGLEAQDALQGTDPAQRVLLDRLYREPAAERVIAGALLSRAKGELTRNAQREQYERYPYPRWSREPLMPAAIPPAAHAHLPRARWWRKPKVLLAGCGTGLQCLSARSTYADASITAIDFSLHSLAYAVRKCREARADGIAFELADLLAYAKRGPRFDLMECIGVLHHLSDLDAGAAALRALVRTGGLLRLAVYSAAAREPVRQLRGVIAARGLDGSLRSLRQLRAEVLAGSHGELSPAVLESPDLHSASGLHDLLFNACEHNLGAREWSSLLERHGFRLACMDPPAATLAQAGPSAQSWGPAEWEAFEVAHPYAFASMYEFWFVAA